MSMSSPPTKVAPSKRPPLPSWQPTLTPWITALVKFALLSDRPRNANWVPPSTAPVKSVAASVTTLRWPLAASVSLSWCR